MRTALFLGSGLLLLAAVTILAKLFSENVPSAANWAILGFIVVWFGLTAANMWLGVNKAGYPAAEELPILLLLFALPAAAALLIRWKVL
jgi:hypothetical protein